MLTCVDCCNIITGRLRKVAVKQPDEGKNAASRTDRKEENKPGSDSSLSEQESLVRQRRISMSLIPGSPDENGDDPGAAGLNLPVSQTGDPSANSSKAMTFLGLLLHGLKIWMIIPFHSVIGDGTLMWAISDSG